MKEKVVLSSDRFKNAYFLTGDIDRVNNNPPFFTT